MKSILVTGADGHLGGEIARWLIENTDRQLLLWVRATDEKARRLKRQALHELLATGRCQLVAGDLRQTSPFAEVDPAHVATIIHAAAVTNFGVEGSQTSTGIATIDLPSISIVKVGLGM